MTISSFQDEPSVTPSLFQPQEQPQAEIYIKKKAAKISSQTEPKIQKIQKEELVIGSRTLRMTKVRAGKRIKYMEVGYIKFTL